MCASRVHPPGTVSTVVELDTLLAGEAGGNHVALHSVVKTTLGQHTKYVLVGQPNLCSQKMFVVSTNGGLWDPVAGWVDSEGKAAGDGDKKMKDVLWFLQKGPADAKFNESRVALLKLLRHVLTNVEAQHGSQ